MVFITLRVRLFSLPIYVSISICLIVIGFFMNSEMVVIFTIVYRLAAKNLLPVDYGNNRPNKLFRNICYVLHDWNGTKT